MNESTRAIIIIILILILLLAIAFFGTGYMIRRAVKTVIRIFRDYQALTPERAMTIEALGLQSRTFFQFRGFRDYKPSALQFLIKNNIVVATEDGRLYLSEDALFRSNIEQNIGGSQRL